MTVETDSPKHTSLMVVGPDGFTETFTRDTVDLLVRLGLIRWWATSGSSDWEVEIYKATGRLSMDVGGE